MKKIYLQTLTLCLLLVASLSASAETVTAKWDFKNDIPAGIQESTNYQGKVADVVSDVADIVMHVDATSGKLYCVGRNNAQMNPGTVLQIPVVSNEDVVTVEGYPGYCHFAVGGDENGGESVVSHIATNAEVKQGYVEVTATAGNNYIYSIQVVQNKDKAAVVYKDEPAIATFPFTLGTEGQTADFGDAADFFLNSKVTYGSGLNLKDANSGAGIAETRFEPYDQNNSADATNLIQFTIQPKFGLTFTPTKVKLNATRFGTDNGLLDIAWLNADGSTVTLATEVKPNRNSGTNPAIAEEEGQKYSKLSYDVKGATPGEGVCGLLVNLYHLQSGKQIGFADIVIEGTINGQIISVPMLGSFSANGVNYVADNVFEADGDNYVATIELSKSEEMISPNNPVADVVALAGEVGDITYKGDETACVATVPVALNDITINYIVNFVQKPDFTLTYVNTDGSQMGTQAVEKDAAIREFAIDYNEAIAEEGYKVRGWFEKKSGGRKYTTADVITSDITLYAVATEIEVPHDYKKYNFDLTSTTFYPEDHEAFTSTGSGYWHDVQHGWAFNNGDVITLLVGEKATIFVTNCQYSNADAQLVFKDAQGNEVGRIAGKGEGDGQIDAFAYEGSAGELFMEIESKGAVYIHNIKIVNTKTTNYQQEGRWYFVKKNDVSSLYDVLDVVSGVNASKDAERSYIFIPDGTYDMGETVLTAVSGYNISIIGQSTEGTIIKNAPDVATEGIGTTAVLVNSTQNLYMQDLTLKNELDYYSAGSAGRAVCFQDKGDRAIMKNVAMLSYQDTYYSQNTKQSYFEDCDIHGTVDFICGGGDVRFVNTTLSLEPRNANGTGGRTITAPTTTTEFGYVFDGCKVVDLAEGKGDWNFGRTWQNYPICIYLNTTLDANSAKTLVSSRWTQKGMNNKDPKIFGEFNTMDEAGNNITPSSNYITSFKGTFQTILSADEADAYSYDRMFTNWDPAYLTIQAEAPEATYSDGLVSWKPANNGAIAYALFKNGEFVTVVEGTDYEIELTENDKLTIRAANSMGGFGEEKEVQVAAPISEDGGFVDGVNAVENNPADETVYNLQGIRVKNASKGVFIVNGKKVIK
ncbi:MAG: InlB B-repeat-containing protein [Prevotella sp.]|nr:InlB B-repeat-containing protein [Prevotella sp.]